MHVNTHVIPSLRTEKFDALEMRLDERLSSLTQGTTATKGHAQSRFVCVFHKRSPGHGDIVNILLVAIGETKIAIAQ